MQVTAEECRDAQCGTSIQCVSGCTTTVASALHGSATTSWPKTSTLPPSCCTAGEPPQGFRNYVTHAAAAALPVAPVLFRASLSGTVLPAPVPSPPCHIHVVMSAAVAGSTRHQASKHHSLHGTTDELCLFGQRDLRCRAFMFTQDLTLTHSATQVGKKGSPPYYAESPRPCVVLNLWPITGICAEFEGLCGPPSCSRWRPFFKTTRFRGAVGAMG